MFKIGDKVKFLNDVGGGVIVNFQSKNIATVENHEGFEIPVMIHQLVKVPENETYEGRRPKPEEVIMQPVKAVPVPEPENKPELIPGNDEPKFYMAFYPTDQKNPVGGEIEIYFINDSNFTLQYHYAHYDGELYTTIDAGELEPNTKNFIEGISQADLNNLPKFWFRIIPYLKSSKKLIAPITKEVSVNAVKFYKEKSFTPNEFFEGNAMVFDLVANPMMEEIDKLTDKDFQKVIQEKDIENRPKEEKKQLQKTPDIVEVDLHIGELIEKTAGLSNREILDIQLDHFEREMELAVKSQVKRIVFIHGVGNGVLKQEIAKKLKAKYARFNSQDASFQEYGFGATMVILRRK